MSAATLWLPPFVLLSVLPLSGCPAGGVGDPCVPEEEYLPDFSGFAVTEASTESRSFQCQSRLCLVNHFQGRVSCPYGQAAGQAQCRLPDGETAVQAAVKAQLVERPASAAVYCSCRCAGPDPEARYCDCPSGFSCTPVLPELDQAGAELPGSYCVRNGTAYSSEQVSNLECDPALHNCEGR